MRIVTVDITNGMTNVLNLIYDAFAYVFNQMDSITMFGTSLLKIFLGITILGIGLPIFLTISKNIVQTGERIRPKRSEKNDNRE